MDKKSWAIVLISFVFVLIGAACLFFFDWGGLLGGSNAVSTIPTETSSPTKEALIQENVLLYFAADEGNYLSSEERIIEIKSKDELPKAIVEELIKGPKTPALSRTIHEGTKINSVKIEEKIATVDFTQTLVTLNTGGSTRETMCVYSIVNSLCERPEIEKVRFSVDGVILKTFGQFDMTDPYEKNIDIIKTNK